VEPFNPFDPGMAEDPYSHYARLRDLDPVHHSEVIGGWVLSRYDHVKMALHDWERFSSAPLGGGMGGFRFLIGSDPPDHTALRRLVNRPFHPRAIAAMEPRIREICTGLLDELLEHGTAGT